MQLHDWMRPRPGGRQTKAPVPPSPRSRLWTFAWAVVKYSTVFGAKVIYQQYQTFSEEYDSNDGDVREILRRKVKKIRDKFVQEHFEKSLVLISADVGTSAASVASKVSLWSKMTRTTLSK